MTVGGLFGHVLPLVLVAAVSPVMFVNASRITLARDAAAGVRFAAGAGSVLVVLGVTAMGVMGAAVTALVERELASRWVDGVLALVLIGYGVGQLARHYSPSPSQPEPGSPGSSPGAASTRGVFAAGALGMATNFTSIPLFVSAAQQLSTVQAGLWVRILLLAVASWLVLTPAWLPPVLAKTAHGTGLGIGSGSGIARSHLKAVIRWISIGSCFVGGALILLHAIQG